MDNTELREHTMALLNLIMLYGASHQICPEHLVRMVTMVTNSLSLALVEEGGDR